MSKLQDASHYRTVEEVSLIVGCSKRAVYFAIAEQRLPAKVINGALMVRRQDCDAYKPKKGFPKGGNHTRETREKMSAVQLGRKRGSYKKC